MNWTRLAQPYVTIDTRALVPPAFAEGGVYADNQDVLCAIIHEIGYIVAEWRVAACMSSQVNPVQNRD